MKKLSIARAWEETVAFVKREPGSLLLISFGLIALPSLIFQAAGPEVRPGQTPEPGLWMLLFFPLIILSILGSLTITAMALRPDSDAGSAFSLALKRLPVMLGTILLIAVGALLLALPFAILSVVAAAGGRGAMLTIAVLLALAFAVVWVRLMLMTPVAAAESKGPVAILKRSWALTSGHTLRLFGFILVVVIVFLVVMLAVSAIFGSVIILAAGQPQDGNLSSVLIALVGGITNAALGLFLTAMIARIYAQLAEEPISGS
jgi:hypothetical protein